jgi:hypothetical protein
VRPAASTRISVYRRRRPEECLQSALFRHNSPTRGHLKLPGGLDRKSALAVSANRSVNVRHGVGWVLLTELTSLVLVHPSLGLGRVAVGSVPTQLRQYPLVDGLPHDHSEP